MSTPHKTVDDYWREALPVFKQKMEIARDREMEALLERMVALCAFVTQNLEEKWTRERETAAHLNPMMVLAFDLLRGSWEAQRSLSMAAASLCARTSFEIKVGFKFLTKSIHPKTYAERFFRYFDLERLKRHYSGFLPLEQHEVDRITQVCSEWINPKTNRPRSRSSWHGKETFKELCREVGEQHAYDQFYSTASAFTHVSYAIHRAYLVGRSMQPVAKTTAVSQQSLLAVGNYAIFLMDYVRFFGVDVPPDEFAVILAAVKAQQPRLISERG